MNIEKRPTPKTNAERRRLKRSKSFPSEPVDAEFARKLERHRDALRDALNAILKAEERFIASIGYEWDDGVNAAINGITEAVKLGKETLEATE